MSSATAASLGQSGNAAAPSSPRRVTAKKREFLATLNRLALEAKVANELELKRREQLEKKRQVEEAQRAAKEAEERKIELERLKSEAGVESEREKEHRRTLEKAHQEAQAVVDWYKSLECRALPSPSEIDSLNTYLSLWKSETPDDSNLTVVPLVEQCAVAEAVSQLVQTTHGVALEDLDFETAKWFAYYVRKLRLISKNKTDDYTRVFLSSLDSAEPSVITNTFTGLNMGYVHVSQQQQYQQQQPHQQSQIAGSSTNTSALAASTHGSDVEVARCWGSPNVSMAFWAHTKIPPEASRRVTLSFSPLGMVIEVPTALQSSRIGLRVIWTRYNSAFEERPDDEIYLHVNKKASEKSLQKLEDECKAIREEAVRSALEAGEDESTANELGEAGVRAHKMTSSFRDRPGIALGMDVWPLMTPESAVTEEDIIVASPESGATRIDKNEILPGFYAPRPLLASTEEEARRKVEGLEELETAMRCAEVFGQPAARSMLFSPCYYTSVGGLVNIEQLRLPPAPLSWGQRIAPVLTLTTPGGKIVTVPYPSSEGSVSEGPVGVSFTLPDDIVVQEPLLLAYWNASKRLWDAGDIQLKSYDPFTRRVDGRFPRLLPFAVIQPRALDFPYHVWSVGPNGPGVLKVTVQGSRFQVVFELIGHTAKLIEPKIRALRSVLDVPMEPGLLLLRLQQRGIDLLPTDSDAHRMRIPKKSRKLESVLHEHVASVAALCHVQSIIWNSHQGSDSALLSYQLAGSESALLPDGLKDPAEEILNQLGVKFSAAHIGNTGFVATALPPIIPGSTPAALHMGQQALLEAQIAAAGASGKTSLSIEDIQAGKITSERLNTGVGAGGSQPTNIGANPDANPDELQNSDEAALNAFAPSVRANDAETYELLLQATAMERKLNKLVEEGTHTAEEAGLALDQHVSGLLGAWRAVIVNEEKCLAVQASQVNPSIDPRTGRTSHVTLRRVIAEERALDMLSNLDQEISLAESVLEQSQKAIDSVIVADLDLQEEHNRNIAVVDQLRVKREHLFHSHVEDAMSYFTRSDESNLILVQQTCRKLLNLLRPFSFS